MKNRKPIFVLSALLLGAASSASLGFANLPIGNADKSLDANDGILLVSPVDPIAVEAGISADDFKKELPSTVDAMLTDGTTKAYDVAWKTPTAEQLAAKGTFVLEGTLSGTSRTIELKVTVKEVIQTVIPSARVNTGKKPTLPLTAQKVFSDGSTKPLAIEWTDTSAVDTSKAGTYPISGRLSDGEQVESTVTVIDPVKVDTNHMAEFTNRITSWTNQYNDVKTLSDGNTSGKGVDNWPTSETEGTRTSSFTFGSSAPVVDITKLKFYFFTGEANCVVPNSISVSYDDNTIDGGGTYKKLDADVQKEGNVWTLTPKNGKVFRANWLYIQFTNNQGEWSNFSEIEVIRSEDSTVQSVANNYATDLKVNGKSVPGFVSGTSQGEGEVQTVYKTTVPYGTQAKDVTVDVPMKDQESGTYVVIPGTLGGEPWKILVFSSDGSSVRSYSLQISQAKPDFVTDSLALDLGSNPSLAAGSSLTLSISGTDASGNPVTDASGQVVYQVQNLTGYAEVRGRTLYGVLPGAVRVSATLIAGDREFQIPAVDVMIEATASQVVATAVEKSYATVTTEDDILASLPKTAKVSLSNGFAIERAVTWKTIPQEFLSKPGTFSIQGYVEGVTDLFAECEVTVIGQGAIEASSSVRFFRLESQTSEAVLPSTMIVGYKTDGTPVTAEVTWSKVSAEATRSRASASDSETWTYTSKDGKYKGNATVSVVAAEKSPDYADVQNGISSAPMPLLSESESGSAVAFANGNGTWTSAGKNPYAGFVFGDNGGATAKPMKKSVNSYTIAFKDAVKDRISNVGFQYYTGNLADSSVLPSDPESYLNVETDKWGKTVLAGEADWTDAAHVVSSWSDDGKVLTVTFDSVSTFAVRAKFTTDATLTATDLKIAGDVHNKDTEISPLENIAVTEDGKPIDIGFAADKNAYDIQVSDASKLVIAPTLGGNATSSYRILPDLGDGVVRLFLTSEDGSQTRQIDFRIASSQSSANVASIRGLDDLTVENGSKLRLPTTVSVVTASGKIVEAPISFDTSSFAGKAGTYTFRGTIDWDSLGLVNVLGIVPQITVTVANDSQAPLPPATFPDSTTSSSSSSSATESETSAPTSSSTTGPTTSDTGVTTAPTTPSTPENKTHAITVKSEGGDVVVSDLAAEAGDTVYVMAKDASKTIVSVSGVNATKVSDGIYSFVMPDSDVTLTVKLADAQGQANPGLGGGDIAAIVLGTLLGVALIGGAAVWILSKKKAK